nr:lipid-A-disaccharide synthase N-terminal domain-containing protein [Parachlamydia acanthamoebae]
MAWPYSLAVSGFNGGVQKNNKKSYLGPLFWWLSAVGECLSLVYFLRIFDPVHFIGPAFGLIPAIRNLMLIAQAKKPLQVKQEA